MKQPSNPYAAIIAMERAKIAEYEKRICACRERIAALESLPGGAQDDIDTALERKLMESSGQFLSSTATGQRTTSIDDLASGVHIFRGAKEFPAEGSQRPETENRYITPMRVREMIDPLNVGEGSEVHSLYITPLRGSKMIESLISSAERSASPPLAQPKREVSPQALELLRFLEKPASLETVFEFVERRGIPMNRAAISTFLYTYRTKYGFLRSIPEGLYLLTLRGKEYVYAPERANVHFVASDAPASPQGQEEGED
ncbi:TPA: hypothetical protein ACXM51_001205 [Stenotrophomonas maltophilia]